MPAEVRKDMRLLAYIFWAAVAVLSLVLMINPHLLSKHFFLHNEELHTVIEAFGAVAAFLTGLLLLSSDTEEAESCTFPALGFVALGVLNACHAVSTPGKGFVFLNNLMLLAGGTGYALGWIPLRLSRKQSQRVVLILIGICFLIAALVWMRRDWFPTAMINKHDFSGVSIGTNILAGILYFIGTCLIFRRYVHSGSPRDFFLINIGVLSAFASLMFFRGHIWGEVWWFWHLLRFLAVIGALIYVLYRWEKLHHDLRERVKENRCLLQVADLGNQPDLPLSGILKSVVNTLPGGWQYPDVAGARIRFGTRFYQSDHYSPSSNSLVEDIYVEGHPAGTVEVTYLGRLSFLEEEKHLLQAVAIQLGQIITEKQLDQRLKQTIRKLQESNRDLEQFAYVASHDLQEPLRMVSSYMQLLDRRYGPQLKGDAKEFMAYAVDGASRMQKLINGLLEYSRINTQASGPGIFSLGVVLDGAIQNLETRILETGAEITRSSMPEICGDPSQMIRVFQNLLSNALKFCNEEIPRVDISCTEHNGCWRIAVADNGIGIDPQFSDKIFVIFQRLNNRDAYGGSGIGLAVCKRIVERHGGSIHVEPGDKSGSVFIITLPKLEEKNESG